MSKSYQGLLPGTVAQPVLNLPAGPVRAALAHCGQQHAPFLWQEHLVTKLCPRLCPGGALARCHSIPYTANRAAAHGQRHPKDPPVQTSLKTKGQRNGQITLF